MAASIVERVEQELKGHMEYCRPLIGHAESFLCLCVINTCAAQIRQTPPVAVITATVLRRRWGVWEFSDMLTMAVPHFAATQRCYYWLTEFIHATIHGTAANTGTRLILLGWHQHTLPVWRSGNTAAALQPHHQRLRLETPGSKYVLLWD